MLLDRTVFRMYVKDGCPYCDQAKHLIIGEKETSLSTIEVSDAPEIRKRIEEETGHKTVPAIYLGQRFIGGFSELQKMDDDGALDLLVLKEEISILKEENARLKRNLV